MSSQDDIVLYIEEAKEKMSKTFDSLNVAFSQIRSGRATPGLVEDIKVDVYGQDMPMNQIASINIPEARSIIIDLWDKSNLQPAEKAIQMSGRNLNPQNDGNLIRINLPEMTEETRKEMVKIAKQKAEDFKVSIRNARRDANDTIKKSKGEGVSEDDIHGYQDEVQKLTDEFNSKIDKAFTAKENDILTV